MIPLIQASGLNVKYTNDEDERPALIDVSFDLREGEIINVVGPNGCGKSTLLRCLAKDREDFAVYRGKIAYLRTDIERFSRVEWNALVGKVYQNAPLGLVTNMTVFENLILHERKLHRLRLFVDIYSERYRESIAQRIDELEKAIGFEFDFELDSAIAELSGGQRQMVALLGLYFQSPKIVLLDEPTSSLDDTKRAKYLRFLEYWIDQDSIGAVMVSHGGNIARSQKYQLIELQDGRRANQK
jgi:ABC-type uncharacterized transport system ATPase component